MVSGVDFGLFVGWFVSQVAIFEEGLELYYKKEFAEAAVCFKQVLKTNPDDKTAKLYLERSAQFMVQGVPDDWDGVETLEHK